MKQEGTKRLILDNALDLFSEKGYDAVSVDQIAKAVGIKAPSLYNHFPSKKAIFEAIVDDTAIHYETDTDKIDIHVQDAHHDAPSFEGISVEKLIEKVHGIFYYSLRDEKVRKFRKMMTIEQFRTSELAQLYSHRYIDRIVAYHSKIFENLIAEGELLDTNSDVLAMMYVSPIVTLIGICDREPERESECIKRLDEHVKLFFDVFNVERGNVNGKIKE